LRWKRVAVLKNVMAFVLKAVSNPKIRALTEHCDYVMAFVGEDQKTVGVYIGVVKAKEGCSKIEEAVSTMRDFVEELGNIFPEGRMVMSQDPEPKPVFMLPISVLGAKFNVQQPE
jgi:hypothetical protein